MNVVGVFLDVWVCVSPSEIIKKKEVKGGRSVFIRHRVGRVFTVSSHLRGRAAILRNRSTEWKSRQEQKEKVRFLPQVVHAGHSQRLALGNRNPDAV